MSSKKITYSSDFKLKVLDYYFKNGGDEIFGLKKKTAGHFNIDKKTINRMLNNPDMVKRARKLMSAKKATSNVKSSTSRQPVKTTVKNAKAGGNASKAAPASRMASSSQSSASSSTSNNNKATTSSTSSTKSISNSSRQVNHTASSGTSSINGGADRSTPSKSKPGGTEAKNSPGVQIFELPEDPDYSLLKKSISSSSNGVASLAKLLVTGTEEVRNVILNECDVILECKVCRNLFRSVVNFLAHKRIYCQEEFADVRTLFHKGDVQGVTSQSNTIVVEPEPPPDNENFNPVRTTVPSSHTSPLKPGSQSRPKHSAIDSIALKLARKRKAFHSSSSTHVGSSSYFQSLSEIGRNRDKLSRDCSVVLEDIGGVSNAVYQSYIPPGSTPKTSMSCIIDEASHSKSGITVAINQNGEIVKTAAGDVSSMDVEEESASAEARDLTCLLCNTRFATQKTLSVHQRSHHGFERCVYSCPICKTSFSSMWAVVRHLQITHKKNKNQIERLRKVVRKNVRKKMVYPSPGKNDAHSDIEKEGNDTTEEAEEEDGDEEDSNDSSSKASEVAVPKRGEVSSALQMSAHKGKSVVSIKRRKFIERFFRDGCSFGDSCRVVIGEHQSVHKHCQSLTTAELAVLREQFRSRWRVASRQKNIFFTKYSKWLDEEVSLHDEDVGMPKRENAELQEKKVYLWNKNPKATVVNGSFDVIFDSAGNSEAESSYDTMLLNRKCRKKRLSLLDNVNYAVDVNGACDVTCDSSRYYRTDSGHEIVPSAFTNGSSQVTEEKIKREPDGSVWLKRRVIVDRFLQNSEEREWTFKEAFHTIVRDHQVAYHHNLTMSPSCLGALCSSFLRRWRQSDCRKDLLMETNEDWLEEDVQLNYIDRKCLVQDE